MNKKFEHWSFEHHYIRIYNYFGNTGRKLGCDLPEWMIVGWLRAMVGVVVAVRAFTTAPCNTGPKDPNSERYSSRLSGGCLLAFNIGVNTFFKKQNKSVLSSD